MRLSHNSVAAALERVARRNRSIASGPREPWRRHTVWRTLGAGREMPATNATNQDGPERLRRVEAILLLAREPLSSRKLSKFANLADATEARTLVRRLNEAYDRRESAFRVEEIAGGFQLLTRPAYGPWLRRLDHVPQETRLSPPAQETLAVVAYRQPTPRAEIEAIRGVSCGEILRQLMERDLVRITGRSDELGRPYLYGTTKRFLRLFGLRSVERLPRVAEMRVEDSPELASNLQTTPPSGFDREMEEDNDVSVTIAPPTVPGEDLDPQQAKLVPDPKCIDDFDDDDFDDDVDDDDDDDDVDDDDDDDDDIDDDDFDDDFDDDDDDDDEDDDDDDWEEVDDDDDDDLDVDDDDDDDDDDDWSDDDDEEEDW